eukprot:764965-Hanusia_phi.AAC.1
MHGGRRRWGRMLGVLLLAACCWSSSQAFSSQVMTRLTSQSWHTCIPLDSKPRSCSRLWIRHRPVHVKNGRARMHSSSEGNHISTAVTSVLKTLSAAAAAIIMFALHVKFVSPSSFAPLGPSGPSLSGEVIVGGVTLLSLVLYDFLRSKKGRMNLALSVCADDKLPTTATAQSKAHTTETYILLGMAYLSSSYLSQLIDILLCALSILDVPLTVGVSRALQVLLSHLFWVFTGSLILQKRTKNFFSSKDWFKVERPNYMTFASIIIGYVITCFVSSFGLFIGNVLSSLNLPILKNFYDMMQSLPESATESVVDKLKRPEGDDLVARVVGGIAPCFTGPIWEEVLYRGYLLQAFSHMMPLSTATDLASLVFALNHMNPRAFAHLYLMGYLWSLLYFRTGNLVVPIAVHMMWNMRTFVAPL